MSSRFLLVGGSTLALAGLLGGILWFSVRDCTELPNLPYHRILLQEDFVSKDLRFKFSMAGSGHTPKGYTFSFTTVRASDCMEITTQTDNEASAAEADEEMERMVQSASHVIERGPKVDRNGQVVGKRAVLLLQNKNERAIIVWTRGISKLFTIESTSLAHALDYERRFAGKAHRYDGRGYLTIP